MEKLALVFLETFLSFLFFEHLKTETVSHSEKPGPQILQGTAYADQGNAFRDCIQSQTCKEA